MPDTLAMAAVWPLTIAALLGALLGVERTLVGKHAGMRTYALVSLGSCLFVALGIGASFQLSGLFPSINPLVVASNVVVAIGFLGIGLTVFRGEHPVELTTAAGLWVAAGIGMACGLGYYMTATAATVLAILVFSILLQVENTLRRRWGSSVE